MDPARRFGELGGGLLTAIGVLGLAITGIAEPLAPMGQHLLVLEVNPAQNLLHLVLGLAMVVGGVGSPRVARISAAAAAAGLGMLGLVGLALVGPTGNPLALNGWGNLLHLGLAGWGATATLRHTDRSSRTDTTAVRHP